MTPADILDIIAAVWLTIVIIGAFVAVTYAVWRMWDR